MAKNTNTTFCQDDIPNIENELAKIVLFFRSNYKIPFICNVDFDVYYDTKDDFACGIVRDVEYMYSFIKVNISKYNNITNIEKDFCHEIAHVALIEYWSFFNVFIGYEDDSQISFQTYKRTEEVMATLLGELLYKQLENGRINGNI